jgi:RNA polymerase sigma factor (sigma-70 family)
VDVPEDVELFCAREHPRLVGALALHTGDYGLAEELAQEALARACRDWPRVRGMEAPGAWVHRVAMNLAASAFRRRAAAHRAQRRLAGMADGIYTERVHSDPDAAELMVVRRAITGLSARKRTVVVLHFYLGYSLVDVASISGLPAGTVRSLLHRAKAELRQALADDPSTQEAHRG